MFSLPENEMTKEPIALLLVGHLPAVVGARTEGAKYVSADCRPLNWGSLATSPSNAIRCRRHYLSIQGLMSSSYSVTDRRVVCLYIFHQLCPGTVHL